MKIFSLLILTFIGSVDGFAQVSFERIWFAGAGASRMNLIELPSHNLFTGLARGPGMTLMDPLGIPIQSNYYWSDSLVREQSFRQSSANEFYFVTGFRKDSCSTIFSLTVPYTHPAIGRMDSLGNVLSLRYYELSGGACVNVPGDLEVTNDGSVITWGRDAYFFALKADPSGEGVWAKHFRNHGGFQFIRELPGGDLLAGINMDTAGVVVARMDADGNFRWCKSYIPGGMIHDCVIESDDAFVIIGATDTIASTNSTIPLPPNYQPKLFMMKLDGDGAVQWCRGYDSAPNPWYSRGQSRIVKAHDNNYVLLANLGVQGYNVAYRPFLMKTNQNGDTLWTRSEGRVNYRYQTIDLLAYSDGGFIYDGSIEGNLPGGLGAAPFISKTDSLGHLPCFERWHSISLLDLFPVDSSFTLSSVDGATMHETLVSDTTFAPIAVYDGCTFTTGMPPTMRQGRTMKVYPNPNAGRFTVQFADPLRAESYYSVYDAMGKLLYQRPLPPGTTLEEVDLARFGTGTYVIKCTDVDGVSYERVVVE